MRDGRIKSRLSRPGKHQIHKCILFLCIIDLIEDAAYTCDPRKTEDYNVSARMCHESFEGAEIAFVWKK